MQLVGGQGALVVRPQSIGDKTRNEIVESHVESDGPSWTQKGNGRRCHAILARALRVGGMLSGQNHQRQHQHREQAGNSRAGLDRMVVRVGFASPPSTRHRGGWCRKDSRVVRSSFGEGLLLLLLERRRSESARRDGTEDTHSRGSARRILHHIRTWKVW